VLDTAEGAPVGLELGVLLGAGTDGLLDGSEDCILVGRVLGMLLGTLESWELGALVGADALLGGADSKMLGICDGSGAWISARCRRLRWRFRIQTAWFL
jgi:hypothetical protein